jgi:hypothetical protein
MGRSRDAAGCLDVASVLGLCPIPRGTAYCTSKFGLVGLFASGVPSYTDGRYGGVSRFRQRGIVREWTGWRSESARTQACGDRVHRGRCGGPQGGAWDVTKSRQGGGHALGPSDVAHQPIPAVDARVGGANRPSQRTDARAPAAVGTPATARVARPNSMNRVSKRRRSMCRVAVQARICADGARAGGGDGTWVRRPASIRIG